MAETAYGLLGSHTVILLDEHPFAGTITRKAARAAYGNSTSGRGPTVSRQLTECISLLSVKEVGYSRLELASFTRLAFPDDQHAPTLFIELLQASFITFHRLGEFLLPKLNAGRGRRATLWAIVAMPKAPVNENHLLARDKHEIWFSRQLSHVESISKPQAVD